MSNNDLKKIFLYINTLVTQSNVKIFEVPRNIKDKEALFKGYEKGLDLPGYFGHNWDALDECMRDLHWIANKQVLIFHSDLPLTDNKEDLGIYLELLAVSVIQWRIASDHRLDVIFPTNVEKEILAILEQRRKDIFEYKKIFEKDFKNR